MKNEDAYKLALHLHLAQASRLSQGIIYGILRCVPDDDPQIEYLILSIGESRREKELIANLPTHFYNMVSCNNEAFPFPKEVRDWLYRELIINTKGNSFLRGSSCAQRIAYWVGANWWCEQQVSRAVEMRQNQQRRRAAHDAAVIHKIKERIRQIGESLVLTLTLNTDRMLGSPHEQEKIKAGSPLEEHFSLQRLSLMGTRDVREKFVAPVGHELLLVLIHLLSGGSSEVKLMRTPNGTYHPPDLE